MLRYKIKSKNIKDSKDEVKNVVSSYNKDLGNILYKNLIEDYVNKKGKYSKIFN